MRWVMTRVFPLPAPARMSTGPSVASTASRCCGLRPERKGGGVDNAYSTVTDLARLRGWSTSRPARTARW